MGGQVFRIQEFGSCHCTFSLSLRIPKYLRIQRGEYSPAPNLGVESEVSSLTRTSWRKSKIGDHFFRSAFTVYAGEGLGGISSMCVYAPTSCCIVFLWFRWPMPPQEPHSCWVLFTSIGGVSYLLKAWNRNVDLGILAYA